MSGRKLKLVFTGCMEKLYLRVVKALFFMPSKTILSAEAFSRSLGVWKIIICQNKCSWEKWVSPNFSIKNNKKF